MVCMNGFFIIAHTPLASALRSAVLHIFPEAAEYTIAFDVLPNLAFEKSLATARSAIEPLLPSSSTPPQDGILIFTDVLGATPSNIASELADGLQINLVAGVNLPMLLKAISYRHKPLESIVSLAVTGGIQGIASIAVTSQDIKNQTS